MYQDSNLRNKIRDCSNLKSWKITTPSIQTFKGKMRAVRFEKNEIQHRDLSKLIAILPLLADQNSDSNKRNKFHDIDKQTVYLK